MKRFFIFLILLSTFWAGFFLKPPKANAAAPTYDNNTVANNNINSSSLTLSNLAVPGTNRLLIVGISYRDYSNTVSSVTFAGSTSLTNSGLTASQSTSGTGRATEIWYVYNPPVTTGNIVITFTVSHTAIAAGAATFNGVNPTTPFGNSQVKVSTGAVNGAQLIVTTSSTNTQTIFGVVAVNASGVRAITPGTFGTILWNQSQTPNCTTPYFPPVIGSGTIIPSASSGTSTTLGWSFNACSGYTNNAYWAGSAVALNPVPPCTVSPPNSFTLASPTSGSTVASLTPTISWNATSNFNDCGTPTYYKIYLNGSLQTTSSATSYTTATLAYSTNYTWTIYACNSSGANCTQSSSGTWNFNTPAAPCTPSTPGPPTSLSTSNIATFSATGNWSAPTSWNDCGQPGSDYYILVNPLLANVNPATSPTNFIGLAANTSYTWQVAACNSSATPSCSGYVSSSFTTACSAAPTTPIIPIDLEITITWSATIPTCWGSPGNCGSIIEDIRGGLVGSR